MSTAISARIAAFQGDLGTLSAPDVFEKHLVQQPCFALDQGEHDAIVQRVAAQFSVPRTAVIIVGSARLGFTLVRKEKAGRATRLPYSPFSANESDVDVAIVSSDLFDRYWRTAFDMHRARVDWPDRDKFSKLLLRGWIFPRLLSRASADTSSVDWDRFFNSLSRTGDCGDFPVKGAVYKDDHFFRSYHHDTITALQAR